MLSWIKSIFKKEDEYITEDIFKEDKVTIGDCTNCPLKDDCKDKNNFTINCIYAVSIKDIDKTKNTILIIDDNEGMVSFLEDDIEYLSDEDIIDLSNTNLLTLSGKHAAFTLKLILTKAKPINIKWAIIDITLGGSVTTAEGNVKYTGIDVYEMLAEANPDIKYIFYTGNNLNPYINANKRMINQFENLTNKDNIMNHVLFKTSMDMDSRREYIAKALFSE